MANEFKYTIRADDRSKQATQSAQRNMGKTEQAAQRLGRTLKTAFTIGGIVTAAKAIQGVSRELINAYAEQERAEKKLATAVKSNPLMDGGAADRIGEFASELQKVTTIGDEVSISFAGMLASFGRTEEEIQTIIQAAVDLSAATGVSLETAVRNLNRTFGGLTGELGEIIPEVRDLTSEELRQGRAVEVVRDMFEGMGEELTQTTNGAMQQFVNAWGDLKEVLGGQLAPQFTNTLNFLTEITTKVTEFVDQIFRLNNSFNALDRVINPDATSMGELVKQGFDSETYRRAMGAQEARLESLREDFSFFRDRMDMVREQNPGLLPQYQKEMNERLNIISQEERLLEELIRAAQAAESSAAEASSNNAAPTVPSGASDEVQEFFNALDYSETRLKNMAFSANLNMDSFDAVANAFLGIEEQTEEVASGLTTLDLQFGKTSGHVETMGKLMSGDLMLAFNHAEGAIRGWQAAVEDATPSPGGGRGSEEFTEGLTGGTGSGESGEEGTTGLGALAGAFAGPIGMLIGYLLELLEKIEAVKALMAPVLIIIDGFLDAVAPAINEGLAPLVGIFYTLGEILGQLLLPILEIFVPVIELLGKAFVWLYNSVFVPVHNQFKTWGNKMYNFFAGVTNALIDIMNRAIRQINKLLPKRRELSYLSRVGTRDLDSGHIDPITYEELAGAGEDYVDGGAGGSPASYTTGRDITVNIDIYSEVIAGEGGIRDLAVMIRDEIREAEALGV